MIMTLKQAKKLYIAAGKKYSAEWWSADDYSQSEWNDIQDEMNRIVAAKSERKAADVIRWWGCWNHTYTAIGFARMVRNIWKGMKSKHDRR